MDIEQYNKHPPSTRVIEDSFRWFTAFTAILKIQPDLFDGIITLTNFIDMKRAKIIRNQLAAIYQASSKTGTTC